MTHEIDTTTATTSHGSMARIVLEGLFAGPSPAPSIAGKFQALWPGIEIRPLYGFDEAGEPLSMEGPAAALLRYEPGASVPPHIHEGVEHIIVLEGAQEDELALYPRGSLVINPPGSQHRVKSEQGCVVLAIWTKPVRVLSE